ncbi:MAG: UDP-glucose/GDP-mannose dehydrogenase family protein [Ignavibacteriales bacterium]|nr:UDP-glucose/GDP-mannose dehydrogenase family protein [Ignavibacteriales bacterium]
MNLSVIGTGYVGLVQGACFADTGNNVICMDIDEKKINSLKKGTIPIYEPGLEELVRKNTQEGRLEFTTSIKTAVQKSDIIFLCLPTPPSEDGSADLTHVLSVTKQIAELANSEKIVVSKSTVPVGTVDKIKQLLKKKSKYAMEVVSNPEFLKEGSALQDSLKPDRVVIGTRSKKTSATLQELYEPFVRTGNPIIVMDERSSEMTKYAANAFLATKISFMNELANLCEEVGADIDSIRRGIGSDPRIGKQFLFPGVGYGGSCFPKDVKALVKTAESYGRELTILRSVDEVNETQKAVLFKKLKQHFKDNLKGKTVALWGLSFKPQTDDIREAPSLVMIRALLNAGVRVRAHDPISNSMVEPLFKGKVEFCESSYDALKDADALLVVTEWNEFRRPDFSKMKKMMKKPVILDGRNIYDPKEMKAKGFTYYSIGR